MYINIYYPPTKYCICTIYIALIWYYRFHIGNIEFNNNYLSIYYDLWSYSIINFMPNYGYIFYILYRYLPITYSSYVGTKYVSKFYNNCLSALYILLIL